MKKINITLVFIFISFLSFSQKNNSTQKADILLKNGFEENQYTGAVGAYSVDGKKAWESAVGYSDFKNKKNITPQTYIRIASIAKPMTAVAIMQLYEQGLIDLDKKIQTYIPDFPEKKEGEITVRHILNHTSGIPAYKNNREVESKKNFPNLKSAVDFFKQRELKGTPGKVYQYTSYGYVVLGLVIENVSGMSYEKYMQKNIWDKAGMKNTGVEIHGKKYKDYTQLYFLKKNGKRKRSKPNDLSNRVPGGGFYSTVGDLLKFGEAVIENKLIKKSSLELMLQNPGIRKKGNGYGFGWFLYGDNPEYGNVFGHSGGQTGCSAQMMILPEQKTVIAVVSNTSNSWNRVFNISTKLFGIAAEEKK